MSVLALAVVGYVALCLLVILGLCMAAAAADRRRAAAACAMAQQPNRRIDASLKPRHTPRGQGPHASGL